MRIRTHLRGIRTSRALSIGDVCAATGLARGEVSMFERGHSIPRDDQVEQMVGVYGSPVGWYPASVLHVLLIDLRDCGGCGDELEPDASGSRRYHSDACRSEARNRARRKPRAEVLSATQT